MREFSASRLSRAAVVVAMFCIIGGCHRSPYELAPVDGVVTIDGKPVTDAKVMFAPIAQGDSRNSGKPAFGELGPDGSFNLTTYHDLDGAVVGDHWVTVIHVEPDAQSEQSGVSAKPAASRTQFDRLAVPKKVSVIASQQNHILIQLTANEVKRFGRHDR